MSTPVGVIRRFVELLTTSSTTGEASVMQALRQFGIDNYDVLVNSYKADEVSSGVRMNNDDTGAITGSDAGGTVTKTAQSRSFPRRRRRSSSQTISTILLRATA